MIGKSGIATKFNVEKDFRSTQTVENLLTLGIQYTETKAQEEEALKSNNYIKNVLSSEADGPDTERRAENIANHDD